VEGGQGGQAILWHYFSDFKEPIVDIIEFFYCQHTEKKKIRQNKTLLCQM
jgi:hypothetical protein